MISHEKKLIFIHIPKTGGMTFSEYLRPYCDEESLRLSPYTSSGDADLNMHAPLCLYYDWYGRKNILDYKIVTICRNPWDKAVSWYMHGFPDKETACTKFDQQKFKDFIRRPQKYHRTPHSHLYYWQNSQLGDLTGIQQEGMFCRTNKRLRYFMKGNWFVKPHYQLSFENYATDVGEFFDAYDIKHDKKDLTRKRNATSHRHYSNYYDDDDIKLIQQVCDFDTMPGYCHPDGYKFEFCYEPIRPGIP
jgi:hypothetical protein